MKKTFAAVLAIIMIFSLSAVALADDGKVFIMGIDPEYPPFSYLGDDGEYT